MICAPINGSVYSLNIFWSYHLSSWSGCWLYLQSFGCSSLLCQRNILDIRSSGARTGIADFYVLDGWVCGLPFMKAHPSCYTFLWPYLCGQMDLIRTYCYSDYLDPCPNHTVSTGISLFLFCDLCRISCSGILGQTRYGIYSLHVVYAKFVSSTSNSKFPYLFFHLYVYPI